MIHRTNGDLFPKVGNHLSCLGCSGLSNSCWAILSRDHMCGWDTCAWRTIPGWEKKGAEHAQRAFLLLGPGLRPLHLNTYHSKSASPDHRLPSKLGHHCLAEMPISTTGSPHLVVRLWRVKSRESRLCCTHFTANFKIPSDMLFT